MTTNQSPDMVKYSDVISIISCNPKCFTNEKEMAQIIRLINNLQKYDLKPVADNITNTTINVIAEKSKVRELVDAIKNNT